MSERNEGEELAGEKKLREEESEVHKSVGSRRVEVDVRRCVLCRQGVVSREADFEVFECFPKTVPLGLWVPWW